MANFGLVIKEKKLCPWKRDGWAYRITKKGRARLAGYGENGKLQAPWLKILRRQQSIW